MLHVTIRTDRFEEEAAFFRAYAGLSVMTEFRTKESRIVFLMDTPEGTRIEIIENPEVSPSEVACLSVGFQAASLDETRDALIRDGFAPTTLISPAPGVRFFFVRDPAGVQIQFMERGA